MNLTNFALKIALNSIFKTINVKIFQGGMPPDPLILYSSFEPHHFPICSDAPGANAKEPVMHTKI